MEQDNRNVIENVDDGATLLRKLHKTHSEFPTYNLGTETTRVFNEGPKYSQLDVSSLCNHVLDADFKDRLEEINLEVRASVAVAIGEVATLFNVYKESGKIDTEIQEKIDKGVHPLNAIAHTYITLFTQAAQVWYEADDSFSEFSREIKEFLDAFILFTEGHSGDLSDGNAAGMISRGCTVGTIIALGCIEVISGCWKDRFDKAITPEELKIHLENKCTYPLLRVWKWMKSGNRLDEFEGYTSIPPKTERNPYMFLRLDSKKFNLFELKEGSNIWNPVPNSDVLEYVKSFQMTDAPPRKRSRCPADSSFEMRELLRHNIMQSNFTQGKSSVDYNGENSVLMDLIDDTHNWAIKYWVPHYEKEYAALVS